MISCIFEMATPHDLDEAIEILAEPDDTVVLAGGTWVVPEMSARHRRPKRVVDLRRTGLDTIAIDGGSLVLGAMCTYRQLARSNVVVDRLPVLVGLAEGITGGPQVRSWGTVGGSACYAGPASDVPGALVGLAASLVLCSSRSTREVPAALFFRDAFETCAAPDELLTQIRIPLPVPGVGLGYHKHKLCTASWPIATATAVVGGDGSASVTLGGVTAVPVTIALDPTAASPTVGDRRLVELVDAVLVEPWSDVLADEAYRRRIAPVVVRRALDCAGARREDDRAR